MLCSPLNVNGYFGGTYCLHLQSCFHGGFLLSLFFRPWRWRQYFPPKRWLTLNGLHSVISQRTVLFNLSFTPRYLNGLWNRTQAVCVTEMSGGPEPLFFLNHAPLHKIRRQCSKRCCWRLLSHLLECFKSVPQPPNVMLEWADSYLLHNRRVPGLNHCPETRYTNWNFRDFRRYLKPNTRIMPSKWQG
jgi:hypothetical protein